MEKISVFLLDKRRINHYNGDLWRLLSSSRLIATSVFVRIGYAVKGGLTCLLLNIRIPGIKRIQCERSAHNVYHLDSGSHCDPLFEF